MNFHSLSRVRSMLGLSPRELREAIFRSGVRPTVANNRQYLSADNLDALEEYLDSRDRRPQRVPDSVPAAVKTSLAPENGATRSSPRTPNGAPQAARDERFGLGTIPKSPQAPKASGGH